MQPPDSPKFGEKLHAPSTSSMSTNAPRNHGVPSLVLRKLGQEETTELYHKLGSKKSKLKIDEMSKLKGSRTDAPNNVAYASIAATERHDANKIQP